MVLILFSFFKSPDLSETFDLASSRSKTSTSEAKRAPIRSVTLAAVFLHVTRAELIRGKPGRKGKKVEVVELHMHEEERE